ncbi:MAG: hypothetical protein AAGA54_15815 [Myxococcota bacterium]
MNPLRLSFPIPRLALAAALLVVGACDDESTSDDTMAEDTDDAGDDTAGDDGTESDGEPTVDEAAILEAANGFASMTRVSDEPVESQHALADTVIFYAADDVADLYLSIDPDAPAETTFPEGALLVKENLDADGNSDGYFAMYKGPEGYDPEGNDWYWLRVDGAGAVGNAGTVGFCKDCHGASASVSDFVFGVPLDNRP